MQRDSSTWKSGRVGLMGLFLSLLLFNKADAQKLPSGGEIRGPFAWKSVIYPGTVRDYWVYVPPQYDGRKPSCLMVVQDGLSCANGWNLPATLDSVILRKEVPALIGIFIDHGKVPAADPGAWPRYNRSFEYDGLGDRYARFLLDEIIPEVGKTYKLSTDPDDRSIAGQSSGAICAFNVAWERPDAFHRVFSAIGTYVGLRGADEMATMVRKTETKPLRIFLEDGTHDLNIYAGDWWMANQAMLSALTWAGYEVNHAWGEGGGHDSKHVNLILRDALKWLWKDYPAEVKTHKGVNAKVNPVIEGEPWEEIVTKGIEVNRLAVNKTGQLFFCAGEKIFRLDAGNATTLVGQLKGAVGGFCFGSDDRLFVSDLSRKVIMEGVSDVIPNAAASFMVATTGGIYFSSMEEPRIGFYSFEKKKTTYIRTPEIPVGIVLSAEQTFLNVGFTNQVFGYSYRVGSDSLTDGQPYTHYHIPYGASTAQSMGMTTDSENLLYTATSAGVQVSDQLGRVNFIFSQPGGRAIDVKIGGTEMNILYANFGGRLFRRKITGKGVLPFMPKVTPPKPGL